MQRQLLGALLLAAAFLAAPLSRADSLTFTVLPPDISGTAGSTIGWGYSITNNSTTDYLDISFVDASVFTIGTADSTPFAFSFVTIAPQTTETQTYDAVNILGLFELTIDPNAAVGAMDTGFFGLYGAFCDPSDPTCAEDGSVASTLLDTANYSATVSGSTGVPIPEPSPLLLLFSGFCAIGLWLCVQKNDSGQRNAH